MTFDAEKTFALRLRQRRTAAGWSQVQFAAKMTEFYGVPMDKATVAKIESGTRRITLTDAFRIATRFGAQIEDFLAEVQCQACEDFPPAGYTCQQCGAVWSVS